VIRKVEPADAQALFELRSANRDYFQRWEPDLGDPERWFTLAGIAEWIADDQQRFAILDDDGAVAGLVSLTGIQRGAFESAMISYFVDAARSGRGLATRAVAEAMRFAFDDLGLHRLEAGTATTNVASQRVLEHNRFTRVGLLRKHLRLAGVWTDHYLWERIRGD
jgi:[ribosomal protein S5]-alanine N-acetyltransferase